jgi:hypothetical protein
VVTISVEGWWIIDVHGRRLCACREAPSKQALWASEKPHFGRVSYTD